MKSRRLGILIYDDVEVLDFAGPFEAFSLAGKELDPKPFEVFTLAEHRRVRARNGLMIENTYMLDDHPELDILLVTGGPGARQEINNEKIIHWLNTQASRVELLLSVCTGALLLAKAGLAKGLTLTTHHQALEELRALAPEENIQTGVPYVDNGKVILSAGVATGIQMSFHVISRLLGREMAVQTAEYMEYPWAESDSN